MKLLVDMNLSPRWVQRLQAAGIEAIHWSNIGRANAPDAEIMAYASKFGFVVLTQDLDFSSMLASTANQRPSVAQIRSAEVSPELIGTQVVTALLQVAEDLEAGALLTIDPNRTRVRLLPFHTRE
jgi:predicted nuclease of predicted toxin-antitoxin system